MRCECCGRNLNDYESTLKSATTGEYLDICMRCLSDLGIETTGREDLNPFDGVDYDEEDEESEDGDVC